MTLNDLPLGHRAHVVGFAPSAGEARAGRQTAQGGDLEIKLRELGFAENDEVELVQRGPLGGSPISVRLNRTLVALRAAEAAAVLVALKP